MRDTFKLPAMIRCALLLLLTFSTCLPVVAKDFASQVMDATYKLFNKDSTATGFFLREDAQRPANEAILVTANHVLSSMTGDSMLIVLRTPQADGNYRRRDWPVTIRNDGKDLWTKHPSLDIAALRVTLPDDANVAPLPLTALASEDMLTQLKLHITSSLFIMGYPNRVESSDVGFPVARHGSVAGFPLTPVKTHPTILIDFATFAGDSGGPVFVKDTRQPDPENAPPVIVGLVLSQIRQDEKTVTENEERTQHFPMQLSNAAHAQFIRETIERLGK